MINHIVMWTLKNSEDAEKVKSQILIIKDEIDEIVDFEVGINIADSPRACDIVLVSTFKNMDDLNTYRVHPEHLKLIEFLSSYRDQVYAVDYEY